MGHDEIHLRLFDSALLEIGTQKSTTIAGKSCLSPLNNGVILGSRTARHEVQHGLKEVSQRMRDGPFLDHETIEGVLKVASAINHSRDARADRVIRRRIWSPNAVHELVCVVAATG